MPDPNEKAEESKAQDNADGATGDEKKVDDGKDKEEAEPKTLDELLAELPEEKRAVVKAGIEKDTANLKSAHERVKKERNELRDKEKARAKEKEERAEAEGQFKELAEKRKARVNELESALATLKAEHETVSKTAESSKKIIDALLEAEKKELELDEATLELLKDKSAVDQLGWIAKHKESLKTHKREVPRTPEGNEKPTGSGDKPKQEEQGEHQKFDVRDAF